MYGGQSIQRRLHRHNHFNPNTKGSHNLEVKQLKETMSDVGR